MSGIRYRTTRFGALALALAAALVALLAHARPAEAGGVVGTCDDSTFTQVLGGGGSVTFSCGPATLVLASTKIITQNTTINGGNTIALSGFGLRRLFNVNPGATLTLLNITIRDGYSSGDDGGAIYVYNGATLNVSGSRFYSNTTSANWSGGAIVAYGRLDISNSEFAYNKGGAGGAIYPRWDAVATIHNGNFHHNQTLSPSSGWGGAMLVWDGPQVSVDSATTFFSNTAQAGGAIFVTANSALTLTNASVTYNRAITPTGGGLYISGRAFITNSQLTNNTATVGGGGINAEASAQVTIVNSTIALNRALDYAFSLIPDQASGGGIRSLGALSISNSTISNNRTEVGFHPGLGGGIYHQNGVITLNNVTLQANESIHGAGIWMESGSATMNGVTFAGNRATASSGNGAGLHIGSANVTLSGGTFVGNWSTGSGGGLENYGNLTVNNSTFNANYSAYGGGGIANGGWMTLTNSIVSANTSSDAGRGSGGGISNGGTLTLNGVTVRDNNANYNGGGISNGGSLTINSSSVSNNTSYGGDEIGGSAYGGGGIYNGNYIGLNNSTVSGNKTLQVDGGGLYNGRAAIALLFNSTFSGNSAPSWGGGIVSNHAQTTLLHVTISGNSAAAGAGIYNVTVWPTRTVLLQNSLIANNPAPGYNCAQFTGSLDVVSYGYNVSDDDSFNTLCPSFQVFDLSNGDDRLGPLTTNGGPTLTHLPLKGSAAIDRIPQGSNFCGLMYPSDQRGRPRPVNGDADPAIKCDAGAVEVARGELTPWLYLPLMVR